MPRFDVTIAGELNLDLIFYGLPAQLPSEREVLAHEMRLTLGSSSAIVAHNLACLGSRVGFQSRVGSDEMGRMASDRLAAGGVDTSLVRRAAGSKTGLSVILQQDHGRTILTYPGTIAELAPSDLDFSYLCDARHFHLSSFYLQAGLRPHVPDLFRRLKTGALTISLDTNDDPQNLWGDDLLEVLPFVDILLPNRNEACRIAGTDDLDLALQRLAKMVPLVVVKLGSRGAVARRGDEQFEAPALKVEAVDAVGAGDSFNAGFLHQHLLGADLPTCLAWGNLAGALSTTRPGGTEAFGDREYREQFFRENAPVSTRAK